jgi:hypothetical protein
MDRAATVAAVITAPLENAIQMDVPERDKNTSKRIAMAARRGDLAEQHNPIISSSSNINNNTDAANPRKSCFARTDLENMTRADIQKNLKAMGLSASGKVNICWL